MFPARAEEYSSWCSELPISCSHGDEFRSATPTVLQHRGGYTARTRERTRFTEGVGVQRRRPSGIWEAALSNRLQVFGPRLPTTASPPGSTPNWTVSSDRYEAVSRASPRTLYGRLHLELAYAKKQVAAYGQLGTTSGALR